MNILVTGGAGFIGSNIVDQLVEQGHTVSVLDNLSTGRIENLNPKATFYKADICDDGIFEIFSANRFDVIYHEAAQISVQNSIKKPLHDAQTNILGTINLLENARTYGVKKFIFASSAAIYGAPVALPIDEEHRAAPQCGYASSKLSAESYIRMYGLLHGIDYTIFRYGNVYGERQEFHGEGGVVAVFADRAAKGEAVTIFGDGEQTRDFVNVKDVARANVMALDKGNGETINLSSGVRTSVNELWNTMRSVLGCELEAQYAPERPGDILHSYLSPAKAEQVLGWKAEISLQLGLEQYAEWFKNRKPRHTL